GPRVRGAARPSARFRRGRVRHPRRPRARHLSQGRDLGRRQGEARRAGSVRRPRGVEERHAEPVPLMRRAVLVWLPLAVAPLLAAAVRADDLLGEASRADAALEARVHAALVRALYGDPRAAVQEVQALDYERSLQGLRPSGLTDDLQLLAAGL